MIARQNHNKQTNGRETQPVGIQHSNSSSSSCRRRRRLRRCLVVLVAVFTTLDNRDPPPAAVVSRSRSKFTRCVQLTHNKLQLAHWTQCKNRFRMLHSSSSACSWTNYTHTHICICNWRSVTPIPKKEKKERNQKKNLTLSAKQTRSNNKKKVMCVKKVINYHRYRYFVYYFACHNSIELRAKSRKL